jgi:hypothetical protein
MKNIKNENGYIHYTVTDSEITLDNIKVYESRKGTGRKMIEELKEIRLNIRSKFPDSNDAIKDLESKLVSLYTLHH